MLPARVAEEQRGVYLLQSERGGHNATVTGRLIHTATGREDFPAVGDWVLAEPLPAGQAVIRELLERRSKISRKVAGKTTEEQIIAANVDIAFLVTSLNQELNVRRIERYLAVIWESGATPVIVLNKTDLSDATDHAVEEVRSLALGVDVLATSAALGTGVQGISQRIGPGQTAVFIGSSGVGKSSLVNRLMDVQVQGVHEIRSDDKGRHTTTSRQMMVLPGGGLVIDTPGLRELQLWDAEAGISLAFQDIEALAAECAFADCSHAAEPGCAIQQAVDEGDLAMDRLQSYRKLEREQLFVESKKDKSLRSAERKKWKQVHKDYRQRVKFLGK